MKKRKWTLAELRNKNDLTQRGLAQKLEIPDSTIAMYENGSRTPSLKRAQKIAQFFGVSTDDISFGQVDHKLQAQTGTE